MTNDLHMTTYQLGTHAFHALHDKQVGDTTQLLFLATIEIHEDSSEKWLSDYPPDRMVTEIEAQSALVRFQTWHSDRSDSQLLQAHKAWREEQEALTAQYNAANEGCNHRYFEKVETALRRPPEATDLLELAKKFDEKKQADDVRGNVQQEAEPEHEARVRRAVEIGTMALERLNENYRRTRESLGIFRTAEEEAFHRQTTMPRTSEEITKAKKMDEEFRRYRALIQSIERKPNT